MKFLQLNKPCLENWEQMKPNETGSFCEQCAKSVIDFSQLSQYEIALKMKQVNGNICARVTQSQLHSPLPDLETQREYHLPYANIAAGLLIATTLAAGLPMEAKNTVPTAIVNSPASLLKFKKNNPEPTPNVPKSDAHTILKGQVNAEKDGTPVKNAKVTFVTIRKQFSTYTQEDGTFELKIPTALIDNDNVIRVSYLEIKKDEDENGEMFFGYETTDHILTKEDLNTVYKIAAVPHMVYLGGISSYSTKNSPIVIYEGTEIKYKDFTNARLGRKNNCNLENKDTDYFKPEAAMAIYGRKAKYGLYIVTNKPTK